MSRLLDNLAGRTAKLLSWVVFTALLCLSLPGVSRCAPPDRTANSQWAAGHYGLMSHFLPYAASLDDFNQIVDAFDVNAYADDVAKTGAGYVIFTLGQQSYFCAPNQTLNTLCGPVTSHRDLLRDVAVALARHGIRTVAYIPSGAPAPMAVGTRFNEADSGGPGRRRAFQIIWQKVISEYSQRWGSQVSGWWLDGMYDWTKMYAFPDAPNYHSLADACRTGNPRSLIAFNDGSGPYSNHSQFGDWSAGEIHRHEQSLLECDDRWITSRDPATHRPYRLLWNLHTFLGHEFLGNGFGGTQDTPRFSDAYIAGFARRVTAHGGTCQFDVPLHMGGSADPDPKAEGHLSVHFLPQLQAIAQALASHSSAQDRGFNGAENAPAATDLPTSAAPALGNDGSIRTDFVSAENDADVPWWQIDLGSPKRLTAVQLVLSQTTDSKAERTEMQFLGSNDPDFHSGKILAWTMEGTEIPPHGDFHAFFTAPAAYRYFRVSRPPKDYHIFWWKPALRFSECRVFTRK